LKIADVVKGDFRFAHKILQNFLNQGLTKAKRNVQTKFILPVLKFAFPLQNNLKRMKLDLHIYSKLCQVESIYKSLIE